MWVRKSDCVIVCVSSHERNETSNQLVASKCNIMLVNGGGGGGSSSKVCHTSDSEIVDDKTDGKSGG